MPVFREQMARGLLGTDRRSGHCLARRDSFRAATFHSVCVCVIENTRSQVCPIVIRRATDITLYVPSDFIMNLGMISSALPRGGHTI